LGNFVACGQRSGLNASTMTDLITSRLILHPLTVEEATRIVGGIAGSSDVWADGFPGEGDRDAARMTVKAAVSHYGSRAHSDPGSGLPSPVDLADPADPFTCYRIDCRRDGAAIGTIGFHGPPDFRRQVTIGYGLVPHSWGNGYATEAVRALIELCRAHPGVRSLAADTGHDNYASQRVLIKSGFRLVRQDRDLLYYELLLV
jgi:RimJ/RimL family protein N-acetyltransferase